MCQKNPTKQGRKGQKTTRIATNMRRRLHAVQYDTCTLSVLTSPKVDTPDKDFSLNTGETKVFFNQLACLCAHSNIITQVARVDSRTKCVNVRGARDFNGLVPEISMVFTFMRLLKVRVIRIGQVFIKITAVVVGVVVGRHGLVIQIVTVISLLHTWYNQELY
jgi:hypothetical protein